MILTLASSDPYCVVKIHDTKIHKTKTVRTTIHPVWEESFDVIMLQKRDLILHLIVRDWNAINVNECMGEALICPGEFLGIEVNCEYRKG